MLQEDGFPYPTDPQKNADNSTVATSEFPADRSLGSDGLETFDLDGDPIWTSDVEDGDTDEIDEFGLHHAAATTLHSSKISPSHETLLKSPPKLVGRLPILLYLSCNEDFLSPYQCRVRQQIELFEAHTVDIQANAQGRNKPISLGQVGLRCRHCARYSPNDRARGAVLYPSQLTGVYPAAQTMAKVHLLDHCTRIPPSLREELAKLQQSASRGGGRKVWAEMTRVLGVYEDSERGGLRFTSGVGEF